MTAEHVSVAVIGGGQAGLSVSWYLGRTGVDHVVLEAQTPVHAWADTRWDNFTLVTPNWHCRLPGYAYDGRRPRRLHDPRRGRRSGWPAGCRPSSRRCARTPASRRCVAAPQAVSS